MVPVILDTDIGYDPDDLVALLFILKLSQLDLKLIVSADEIAGKRARITKHILKLVGREDIAIAEGETLAGLTKFYMEEFLPPHDEGKIDTDYVGAMKRVVDSADKITYIGIGGFTSLANFLKAHPECAKKLDIFMMGGAVNYSRKENWVEHNIRIDKNAATYVIRHPEINLSMVMSQTTFHPEYEISDACSERLRTSPDPMHNMLFRHLELFSQNTQHKNKSRMHDPLTVSIAAGYDFVTMHTSSLQIDDNGVMSVAEGGKNISWSDPESNKDAFMQFLEERLFFRG